VQPHGDLLTARQGFQLLPGKEVEALRGSKFASSGMRDVTAELQSIRVSFVDDPCLRGVNEDSSEAKPHSIAVGALTILPRSDKRAFAHDLNAFAEHFIHRRGSVLSSRASNSATRER